MKKALALLLIFALLTGLAACGSQKSEAPANEKRTFTDDSGRLVALPEEISRIVPSGPLAQMVLFAIAPDMLVGLASKWSSSAEGFIAEEYLSLPYFGQLYSSADLNIEELAKSAPQLIIDIGEKKETVSKDLDALQKQTGIPSLFISADMETMPDCFRTLGKLLHREERAEELALFCERVYERSLAIMEKVGDNKVRALYVLGDEGLNVIAKDSYHSEILDLVTDNLAAIASPSSKGLGNEVSMEQLALWDPDFVLFAPKSIYGTVGSMEAWSSISAIESGNYVEVPEGPHNWLGNPPGTQRYLSLIWLTQLLYPDYCDYDAKAEIFEHYRLFYGCELTDALYEKLTENAFWK